jgi:hypothetical protein
MSPDPAPLSTAGHPSRSTGLRRTARLGLALAAAAWLTGCIVVPAPHRHPHYRTGGVVVVPGGNEVVRVWEGGVVRRDPHAWRGGRHAPDRYRSGRDRDDD